MTVAATTAARVRPSIAVLVLCSAVQPFALNVLAPATPAMAEALAIDYGAVQLTLTVYLAAVALSQLVIGPISDRIGRRPCIVGGLGLFTLGSLVGVFAPDLTALLAARVLQAAGAGTAFALTRAIARDTGERDEAASLIGYVTMAMVVVPMLAPLAGGFIESTLGWRAIFLAMAVVGLLATLGAFLKLPETRPAGAAVMGWLDTFRAFPVLLRERAFAAHAGGLAMTSATFFAFISGAPFAVIEHMGAGPTGYGLFFITMSGSYMLGNFVTGRFGRAVGSERLARIGNLMSLAGVGAAAALSFTAAWSPALLFVPLMLNGIGNGLSIPTLTASALSVRPAMAGAAAGLMGFAQLSLGAAAAWLAGLFTPVWPQSFLMLMLATTLTAALAPLWARKR
jgi:DHA1 family bicyclomycin/chloramphenicol resistance-like MFS transporter